MFSETVSAASPPPDIWFDRYPEGTIITEGSDLTFVTVLGYVQALILQVALPVLVVGVSLYIAYELFTAEWDEAKMKKAWKSLTFWAIGLVSIGISYAFVSILVRLSL